MSDVIEQVAVGVLHDFADAWNRHDVDALMTFMADDCVFEASAGPDVAGTRNVGREEMRAGFAGVWVAFPDAHWGDARHFVCGSRGVSEWTFTGTRADGTRVRSSWLRSVCVSRRQDCAKNSYRKNRT